MRRRLLTGLLGATLLLGACGDDDGGAEENAAVTSIPDRTTSSTTTTEPQVPPPDVIPSDPSLITEEYVEQVLDALFEVSNESLVLTMREGMVDERVIDLVEATTPETRAADDINELIALASEGFPGIKERPEPITADVLEVTHRGLDCVFARVIVDASGVTTEPQADDSTNTFARLLPATQEQRASGLNPTAWVIDELPVAGAGAEPEHTC